MANTGYKGGYDLEEYDVNTGLPTGNTKPNVESDPDYIEPIYDPSYCPLPFLTILPTNYNADGGIETFIINITSNINWTIVSEAAWMTITSNINGVGNGTVEVSISQNNTTSIRTSNIRIEGEGITRYCGVNQNPVDNIVVSPNYLYFPYTGGSEIINITADSSWSILGSGVGLTPDNGTAGTTEVTVTALLQSNENTVISEINILLDNGENSTLLTVEQEGNPTP